MKLRLLKVGALITMACKPFSSYAHEIGQTHSHAGWATTSLIVIVAAFLLMLALKRTLQRNGAS